MIVVKFNGEIEEKLRTISLLKGIEREELLKKLEKRAIEAVKSEIEREYRDILLLEAA